MTKIKTSRKGFLGKVIAGGCGLMLLPAAFAGNRANPAQSSSAVASLPVKVRKASRTVARLH
jgi:hypothetical protein